MNCLYPDCTTTAEVTEHGKRLLIDHINNDHDDAHVVCACKHELREVERYMATTPSPDTGKTIEVGEQVKSECVRCGDFVVEDAEPVTEEVQP